MPLQDPRSRIDLAFDALAGADWAGTASHARAGLKDAEAQHDENDAALAHFLLGTSLLGPDDATPEMHAEARLHLEAALPALRRIEELELTGEALLLLGGLALDEARTARDAGDALARCEHHYREAAEVFSALDAPESHASALHNLGLCLVALADQAVHSRERRLEHLEDALECFHDALEVEVQNALPALAEASEHERAMAQELRDSA